MSLAESSVRLDPRSSFAFQILAYAHGAEGHHEAAMDAGKRAVGLNPYDMVGVRTVSLSQFWAVPGTGIALEPGGFELQDSTGKAVPLGR